MSHIYSPELSRRFVTSDGRRFAVHYVPAGRSPVFTATDVNGVAL